MDSYQRTALFSVWVLIGLPLLAGLGMLVDSWLLGYVLPAALTIAAAWYARAGDRPERVPAALPDVPPAPPPGVDEGAAIAGGDGAGRLPAEVGK